MFNHRIVQRITIGFKDIGIIPIGKFIGLIDALVQGEDFILSIAQCIIHPSDKFSIDTHLIFHGCVINGSKGAADTLFGCCFDVGCCVWVVEGGGLTAVIVFVYNVGRWWLSLL